MRVVGAGTYSSNKCAEFAPVYFFKGLKMVGHPLTQLKKNTLEALKESVSNSSKIKKVILENMVYEVKKTLTLNLVQITYQFSTRKVFIDYFVEDSSYPGVQMSSDELADFIELP